MIDVSRPEDVVGPAAKFSERQHYDKYDGLYCRTRVHLPRSGHTGSLRTSPFAGLNPEIPNDLTGDE